MGLKSSLRRLFPLLLASLLLAACGNDGGETPSKDDSRSEKSDDDEEDSKKSKKKTSKKKDGNKKVAPDENKVFTAREPKVGDESATTSKQTMSMVVEVGGRKTTIDEVSTKEKIEKVLDVAQGRPAKLEVSYRVRSKKKSKGGKESTEDEPIMGKTYLVEDDGAGSPKVTYDDGSPVPAAEEKLVKKDYRRTFKASRASAKIEKALLSAKLEKGQRVTDAEEAFADYFSEDSNDEGSDKTIDVADVKLVYQGVKGDRAHFDIAFTMKADQKQMVIIMPLTGHLEVRREGAKPVTMKLKGPLEVDASKMPVPVTLTGQLAMELTEVFTPKK